MTHKKIISYDPKLRELARQLRNHSTLSEVLLWKQLKGKKMYGYDFDRQRPIDLFIVDFFCAELMLAIEIDGDSHRGTYEVDHVRQARLEELGVRFLRFHDLMIKKDMINVLRCIEGWILQNAKRHTPNPSREGNRECGPRKGKGLRRKP